MGIFERRRNKRNKINNSSTNTKPQEPNTTFVTYSEEDDFEKSMYGQLQLMSADAELIEAVLYDRGHRIKKQIELITKLLEISNDESDEKVRMAFQELKKDFDEAKRLADGEYTIKELLANNRRMDKTFENYIDTDDLKTALDEYINYIQKIQNKIASNEDKQTPLLNNVQRQRFNQISLNSEYRIKMLELMYLQKRSMAVENPFRNLSVLKQRMFSKFFIEDIKRSIAQYGRIMQDEKLYRINSTSSGGIDYIERTAKKINDLLADVQMIDDFSIRQLFDSKNSSVKSFDVLKDFILFKLRMNSLESNRAGLMEEKVKEDKKREEAERARKAVEEKELKLAEASSKEIADEIYRLEHDLTAKGSRFVNVLDYQKRVANAKGLLDTDAMTQSNDIVCRVFYGVDILKVIENANKSGVNYLVFPDCQENADGGFTVAVSETDKSIFDLQGDFYKYYEQGASEWKDAHNFGKFPPYVLAKVYERIVNEKDLGSDAIENGISLRRGILRLGYYTYRSGIAKKIPKYKEMIEGYIDDAMLDIAEKGNTPKELKDVLCYVNVTATTNIIPILQQFKDAGIEAYMEPIPNRTSTCRNENNRDYIHIYFERRNLNKVKNVVLKEAPLPVFEHSSLGQEIYREIMEENKNSREK